MSKTFVRSNAKKTEIMVPRLHSSKRNVERGGEKKGLEFLKDHAVI